MSLRPRVLSSLMVAFKIGATLSPADLQTQILNFVSHKLTFLRLHAGIAFLTSAPKFPHQA